MRGKVELSGMRFTAYHGCLQSEREQGNLFVVDFSAVYDISAAAFSDNLEYAVDYGKIYEVVKAEMAVPSNLLEHVAARILERLQLDFPELDDICIKVSKHNPPVSGEVEWSSITVRQ